MDLPVMPPVEPMLARLVSVLPTGDGLLYEPKWDGFRCIVFRDGDAIELGSRTGKPLTRYFPEVVRSLLACESERFVLDGEIVIAGPHGLDFDALLARIHPADSRVKKLSEETPASFVGFDLLALDQEDLQGAPFKDRRAKLETVLTEGLAGLYLTPQTSEAELAEIWFSRFEGAGLDGVMAKEAELRYRPGDRVMWKVKHERTADCVVAGFRWHKQDGVGSLVLGLYDDSGQLHHVGVCSGFSAQRRRELVEELEPLRTDLQDHPWRHAGSNEASPGPSTSRWNAGKSLEFEPLRIERVCEVAYDHMQTARFRHATAFRRWRPDRDPASCTYQQLEVAVPVELAEIFAH